MFSTSKLVSNTEPIDDVDVVNLAKNLYVGLTSLHGMMGITCRPPLMNIDRILVYSLVNVDPAQYAQCQCHHSARSTPLQGDKVPVFSLMVARQNIDSPLMLEKEYPEMGQRIEAWIAEVGHESSKLILFNCASGLVGSPAAAITYVSWKLQIPWEESLALFRQMRTAINPLPAFTKVTLCPEWGKEA